MKKLKFLHKLLITFSLIAVLVPVQFSDQLVSSAKAEALCPPPITHSYMEIRRDSATGPLVGQWESHGISPEVLGTWSGVHDSIFVDAGTVLFISSYTEGVELTNYTRGSRHSTNLASTIIAPTNRPPLYRPSGFSFIKQQNVTYRTDPISSSGAAVVAGENSCDAQYPEVYPGANTEMGESRIFISINVVSIPFSCFVQTTSQTIDKGGSGAYTVRVSGAETTTGPVNVWMTTSPNGVTADLTTVNLPGGNPNTAFASVQVFVSQSAATSPPPYTITITASMNGQVVECGRPQLIVRGPDPTIDLVLSPPERVSLVPGSLQYVLEARCTVGLNSLIRDLSVNHGFVYGVTVQILSDTPPYPSDTNIRCGETRTVRLTGSNPTVPINVPVNISVTGNYTTNP